MYLEVCKGSLLHCEHSLQSRACNATPRHDDHGSCMLMQTVQPSVSLSSCAVEHKAASQPAAKKAKKIRPIACRLCRLRGLQPLLQDASAKQSCCYCMLWLVGNSSCCKTILIALQNSFSNSSRRDSEGSSSCSCPAMQQLLRQSRVPMCKSSRCHSRAQETIRTKPCAEAQQAIGTMMLHQLFCCSTKVMLCASVYV